MSENKKAVPGRDGKRATTDSTLNIAQNNITIFSPYNQDWLIAVLLKPGKENAMAAQEIAAMLGLSEVRTISQAIYNERLKGAPICACSRGYYLPESSEEFSSYLSSFTRRFISVKKTLDALKRTQYIVEGQTEIGKPPPMVIDSKQETTIGRTTDE